MRGGIPPKAQRRLAGLAAEGACFTSGLSVDEFALLRLAGVRPLAQVMGSSVYHVGWQGLPWGSWSSLGVSQELSVLSEA